jgi:hypothetical protein
MVSEANRFVVLGLALVLASACGRSQKNGGKPVAVGGEGGDAGSGAPATSGGVMASAGEPSSAAVSSGGEGGSATLAGAPGVAGGAEAGAAAEAGAGGEASTPLPSPWCDDGNPCTLDRPSVDGCQHSKADDGLICEDGDLCTLGDACLQGVCVPGALQTGPGTALGSTSTYGLELAASPGEGQLVFLDGASPGQLTHAQVTELKLERRGQAEVVKDLGYSYVMTAWDDLVAVADGEPTFSLNGPDRNMQLFSIDSDGSFTPHAIIPITPGSQMNAANKSMVGRGSRLFLCHNFSFFTAPAGTLMWWDVSDPDVPVLVAKGSTRGQCGSIAASEDGERVYVNTSNGVIWTDLSHWVSGDITFEAEPLIATDSGLSVRGNRLLARSGELVRVLDVSDHSELSSFTAPGANAAALMGDDIIVSRDVTSNGQTENFLSLYRASGTLKYELLVSDLAFEHDIAWQGLAATGSVVLDTFTRRPFALTPDGFLELDAPELGAMNRVFAGPDAVHVRSKWAAHRVDVSDPTAPAIVAGGPSPLRSLGIKLDLSLPSPGLIPEENSSFAYYDGLDPASVAVEPTRGHQQATLLQRAAADSKEQFRRIDGSIALPGGTATLYGAGDYLYRAAFDATVGAQLQRWLVSDLLAGVESPQMELSFDAPAGVTEPSVSFDVDPMARIGVLSARWRDNAGDFGTIYWLDLTTQPPTVLEQISALANQVKVRGDKLVYLNRFYDDNTLHFRQRGSEAEVTFDTVAPVTRLLAFDGAHTYYATRYALRAVTHRDPDPPVLTLDIPSRGPVASLTSMPGSLVAVTPMQLLTLAPSCQRRCEALAQQSQLLQPGDEGGTCGSETAAARLGAPCNLGRSRR